MFPGRCHAAEIVVNRAPQDIADGKDQKDNGPETDPEDEADHRPQAGDVEEVDQ